MKIKIHLTQLHARKQRHTRLTGNPHTPTRAQIAQNFTNQSLYSQGRYGTIHAGQRLNENSLIIDSRRRCGTTLSEPATVQREYRKPHLHHNFMTLQTERPKGSRLQQRQQGQRKGPKRSRTVGKVHYISLVSKLPASTSKRLPTQ